jgi:diaminohydroxyphosphoribosylaminopyrimidine deaminase / 5-amino-6-(5-phosphoribosylamino)uracil reductase
MSGIHEHERWMRRCLTLAAEASGAVSPNPMVGAVLVTTDGFVLGEGRHRVYGGPHAEVEALREAQQQHGRAAISDATLYVSLEPCCHHGKTPPCTDLILEAGVKRVVVAMTDPFPAVAGKGIKRLREAGIEVVERVLEPDAVRLNEAFIRSVRFGLPLTILKQAMTLDGRVATDEGDARWITGPASRTLVHRWRRELDAVLVGSTTVRLDDPQLTVRHVDGRQPVRIILDRSGSLGSNLRVFNDEFVHRTVVFVSEGADPAYREELERRGGQLFPVRLVGEHMDLHDMLRHLATEPVNDGKPVHSVLVEAGHGLASALVAADLIDRHYVFIAPRVLGGGLPLLTTRSPGRMGEARQFPEHTWEQVGDDMLFKGYVRPTFSYITEV